MRMWIEFYIGSIGGYIHIPHFNSAAYNGVVSRYRALVGNSVAYNDVLALQIRVLLCGYCILRPVFFPTIVYLPPASYCSSCLFSTKRCAAVSIVSTAKVGTHRPAPDHDSVSNKLSQLEPAKVLSKFRAGPQPWGLFDSNASASRHGQRRIGLWLDWPSWWSKGLDRDVLWCFPYVAGIGATHGSADNHVNKQTGFLEVWWLLDRLAPKQVIDTLNIVKHW
jgi:hypothetical protein